MKKIFSQKGSIFIIALNVILILSIGLISISSNGFLRYKAVRHYNDQYKAYLNAQSGFYLGLNKLKEKKIDKFPYKEEITLYDDEDHKVEIKIDEGNYIKKDNHYKFQESFNSTSKRIICKGIYKKTTSTLIYIIKGEKSRFYFIKK